MPTAIALQLGSTLKAQSRAGMAATVIQSTAASRPRCDALSWLMMVEKVLLIRPSSAAASQFDFGCMSLDRRNANEGPAAPVPTGMRASSSRKLEPLQRQAVGNQPLLQPEP